jgi:hypothetical protein
VTRVFNGLLREEIQKHRARMLSPSSRPTQLQPYADGSFVKLITCPKCGGKGLPAQNSLDATWLQDCKRCGALFAFHPQGLTPTEAIQQAGGHRDRHPLIRERGEGKHRHIDANAFAEADWEARTMGRRARSLGILPSR